MCSGRSWQPIIRDHYRRNRGEWNIFCVAVERVDNTVYRGRSAALMHSILLVDDEPEILAAWRLILENEGYEVGCASNGVEAVARAVARAPALIITDWMMPLMDGAELCRRLKAIPALANVPILVHTSVPPNEAAGKNWDVCLRKPVGATLFLTTVAQLCTQRR
ncbi:response regulator receiver protein [Paraburkholderia phytofirmans PsJN]|uniref:Response regulator receiver protein n=2 Tax=Paraburkholderia phytofirmans TaxID=261302 RepID=B2TFZ2_PARPJ|nr:response regulator receiver protein [Paraburkholderia phytofirmans PsJN]